MNIEHRPEGELGSFFAIDDGTEAGELAYRRKSDRIMLDHTDVEPAFKGRNVGKQLVLAAVEYARSNNLKIEPVCTYADLLFKRNPDWSRASLIDKCITGAQLSSNAERAMITDSGNIQVKTPIGSIWISSAGEKITALSFDQPADPIENPSRVLIEASNQINAYFHGRLKKFELPIQLIGSDHQKKVWVIIAEIPFGRTLTYSTIAERFGGNTFARAVGTACGANPIPIIIPCHRVIASDGRLTGYLGGIDRKRSLLEMEGAIPELQKELF